MGTISDDILYASQQINVPLNLPYILKQYAKAAIKTQPRDLLNWSSAYFRALANGDVPPVKDRIEYPLIATPSGLTAGFLRVLIKQFGKSGIVEEKELINKWKGVGLELDELQNMLRLCGFRKTVRWLNFVAVAAGFLSPNLTQTMILICELLTDEPEGGSAAILHQTFMTLYIYLARMDCGPICHLKSNMDDTFSEQVSAEDLLGKADDEVETEKSSEKLSEIEVALERKPTLDSNNSSNGVMVWEDVTHPVLVQEKTGEETVEENAENLADNMPVDVVDEPTTVVDEEEKADDQESVKSTESYDNTGITLKFHDSEQDVKIDDYTGPIEPKLKKRFEKKFGEEQEEETEEKTDANETEENGDKDDKEEEKEGEEQEQVEEKENEEKGAKEETKEDENKRDSKAEDEVDHKEEDGKENGDKTEEVIEKIEEGGGDEEKKEEEEEEGDKKEVEQEVKGNGEEDKEEEGKEEKEEAKEAEVEGKKVEEEEKEGEEKKKEVEEDVKEGEVKEGEVEEGEEEEKKDVKEEVKEGEEEKKKEDEEEVKEIEETKETDKKEESGETEKTPTPTTKTRKKKSAKKEGENEVETKEEGEEEESDHEEQSRYEYSLELEEEEERVGEEEKSVKEELKEATENVEEVEEKMAEEEEEKAEEEGEEEELKEEESVELKMTDSAIPLQGQRKSNIEVYGSIHLPKHRNLSFTDSIVSEPDNHFWANVPGIGALVPEKQILTLKAYFLYCSEKQNGFIMPRNIKHHLCPSLEPPVVAMEKRNLGSSEVELINREGEHKRISF